jgi:hypothetical protein
MIPATIRQQYNITSNTLLPDVTPPTDVKTGFIEIANDDKVIKAFLVARNLIGPRTENSTLLRDALMKHAKAQNKRLIFL